ncbi:class II aldolase/adducin family protein [Candidatus Contubernalis alkaliaceticus]|uniref:class II aldolase/adducin family protein n=1 Tax=Candidatus Contubernalis alkaliaceticus TaxID=338645 RepID=UPI001F4C49DC|nr:class II aldolase/adducin family protein [Candidatus Contubernalis alkalaceticus]UNC92437.1 class II aldolase/adducin family protein [Candidatus Contubernalis alkalaceticus]
MLETEKNKEQVARIAKKMLEENLVVETWGNVSARSKEGMVITPSGLDYKKLNFTDMVVMDLHGNVKEGKWKPSSEHPMHRLIYQRRHDVNAVMHTHSIYATAFAVARKEINTVVEDFSQVLGGSVKVADYAMPGSDVLALNCVDALEDRSAVLIANHGLVAVGKTLEEVLLICKVIEKTALISLYANMLGGPVVIDEQHVVRLHKYFKEQYGQK